jgi:GT2 family glycosyltransferase
MMANNVAGSRPLLAVVVLNWNRKEDTLLCLDSLLRQNYEPCRVFVVDNGSTDGSVDCFRRRFPDCEVIETGRNLGYAGGNNVGIRAALVTCAEYIVVLNNDTIVAPDALSRAVQVADSGGPALGMVGFAVYELERPDVLHNAGMTVTAMLDGEWFRPSLEELVRQPWLPIQTVHGSAMLLSRHLIVKVGMFDERYFLMHEESDLAARARCAGFRIAVACGAKVWHQGATTFRGYSPLKRFYDRRNAPLFVRLRLEEEGRLDAFPEFDMRYRQRNRNEVAFFVRQRMFRHAQATLTAERCADLGLWGARRVPWTVQVGSVAKQVQLFVNLIFRRIGRTLGTNWMA